MVHVYIKKLKFWDFEAPRARRSHERVLVLGLAAVFAAGCWWRCPLPPDAVLPEHVRCRPLGSHAGWRRGRLGAGVRTAASLRGAKCRVCVRWNALKHWGDPKYVADRWLAQGARHKSGHCSDAVVRAAVRETTEIRWRRRWHERAVNASEFFGAAADPGDGGALTCNLDGDVQTCGCTLHTHPRPSDKSPPGSG